MKTGAKWFGGLSVILIAVAVIGFVVVKRSDSSPGLLKTVRLEKGDLVLSIPATGIIEPLFSVEVKSKASGEIEEIMAEEGDHIQKGDLLVKINPKIEEIGVRRAEADLMAAKATVKKGKILLEMAVLSRLRKEKLYKKGFISDEEHEESRHDVALREADLLLSQAERIRAEESLSESKERLVETRVLSPLSGTILTLDVKRGQIISSGTSSFSQGTPLAVIGDLSALRIRAEVDETDARKVALDQEAMIRFDAFPELSYRAHVIRIAPLAKMKNDLAIVEILLALDGPEDSTQSHDNPALRPGLSADVVVVTQRLRDVPLLVRDVLYRREGAWGISIVEGGEVSFREVTLGATDGEWVEIKTDLPIGTKVALGGFNLKEKSVRGRPAGRP